MPGLLDLPTEILTEIINYLDSYPDANALAQISFVLFRLTEPIRYRRLEFRNARLQGALSRFLRYILETRPIVVTFVQQLRLAWSNVDDTEDEDEQMLAEEAEFLYEYTQRLIQSGSIAPHTEILTHLHECHSPTRRACLLLYLLPKLQMLTLSEENANNLFDFSLPISNDEDSDPQFLSSVRHVHLALLDGFEAPLGILRVFWSLQGVRMISGVRIHAPLDSYFDWDGEWTEMNRQSNVTEYDFRKSDIQTGYSYICRVLLIPRCLQRFAYDFDWISSSDGLNVRELSETLQMVHDTLVDLKIRSRFPSAHYDINATLELVSDISSESTGPDSTCRILFPKLRTLNIDVHLLLGRRPDSAHRYSGQNLNLGTLIPNGLEELTLWLHDDFEERPASLFSSRREAWFPGGASIPEEPFLWNLEQVMGYLVCLLQEQEVTLPRLRTLKLGFGNGSLATTPAPYMNSPWWHKVKEAGVKASVQVLATDAYLDEWFHESPETYWFVS